ncbi:MAG: hypothetical protein GY754_22885 [bacterium]|nr:hypothetical protein [bacterium]
MFCERCKQNDATIHLTEIIQGERSEIHLCEKCAKDIGLNSKLSNFSLSVPEMLSFLDINEVSEYDDIHTCKRCGTAFSDYKANSKLGCQECYVYLADYLVSEISGFHGEKRHIGKIPNTMATQIEVTRDIPLEIQDESLYDLKIQLETAVSEERYENAAVLRDKIKDLERIS